jgi:7,8-dihydroneopterin aldolase/epimerase/oxygenase
MAWVALEGMRFHAFHGVYEAEQVLGGEYMVDVYVSTGIGAASKKDSLEDTHVNYETVFQICLVEMATPRKLLETVVTAIIAKMKHQFPAMKTIRVRVKKLNPPIFGKMQAGGKYEAIAGQAAAAWVEDEQKFVEKCPRCKEDFLCYKDETCWCKALTNVHPATLETLTRQYGTSCICGKCLKLYAG